MKKIFLSFMVFLFVNTLSFAGEIHRYIKKSNFELNSTVSVYAKKGEKVVYKNHAKKLLNPASVLKLLTFGASYKVLGDDYNFETALYKDNNGNYYLKLGADTLLATKDLETLFSGIKNIKINKLYIDDSIIEATTYPESWMKEDMFPAQRAITPYIIDNNLAEIALKRSSLATTVDITQNDLYKFPIINNLKPGETQSYKIEKIDLGNSYAIAFSGTISSDLTLRLPVYNPELNFEIKLLNVMQNAGIKYSDKIATKKVPQDAVKIACVSHSIQEISKNILLSSDNFASEVIFKAGSAKYINYAHSATLDDAINMFYDVYKDELTEGIKITDGSGVSRQNLVNSEFVVNCLDKLFKNEKFKNLLATASEGTLANRMNFLCGNLRAKTGTLSNMSSISGILNSKKGNDIIFAIIVQNSPKRTAVLKNFENNLITILYRRY